MENGPFLALTLAPHQNSSKLLLTTGTYDDILRSCSNDLVRSLPVIKENEVATKTKSKVKKAVSKVTKAVKKAVTKAGKAAVRMIRGVGDNRQTFYQCIPIEEARRERRKILVWKKNPKTERMQEMAVPCRLLHRPDFVTATYHENHGTNPNQGKYVASKALSKDGKTVTGAHLVTPYLDEDGSYATIVEFLMNNIGKAVTGPMSATVHRSLADGDHLQWTGPRNFDGILTRSGWFTENQLWDLCRKANPQLIKILKKSKSKSAKGKKAHQTPRQKFGGNIEVIRRTVWSINAATGERSVGGGYTPCGKPMEQAQFAIDKRFLTTGFDQETGMETGDVFFSLAIGRSETSDLSPADWGYQDSNSRIAFLNDKVMALVAKARKVVTKKAA